MIYTVTVVPTNEGSTLTACLGWNYKGSEAEKKALLKCLEMKRYLKGLKCKVLLFENGKMVEEFNP